MGSVPVGVQGPLTSSLGEFLGYWAGSGILGPCWRPSPFPSPSRSAIGFQSCFFFTADISAPTRSTLHLFTFKVSFQAWDWLWYPMLWSQRWNRGAHGAEISISDFSPVRGVEPRTVASSGRERSH